MRRSSNLRSSKCRLPTDHSERRLVGEPAIVPTGAAVADAIHDAIGIRIQSTPITPEKIVRALGLIGGANGS